MDRSARRLLLQYLICASAAGLFASAYVAAEQPLYVWDWRLYWNVYQYVGGLAEGGWSDPLEVVRGSLAWSDYNALGVVPLVPVYLLFGGGRTPYVVAICVLYVVPATLVAARLASDDDGKTAPATPVLASALLIPTFWSSALRGMIDVVGLIPLGTAAIVIWNGRFLTASTSGKASLVGFLAWLTFALRRWYAFSIVALFAVSVAGVAIMLLRKGRVFSSAARGQVREAVSRWLVVLRTIVLGLLLFQLPLVANILVTDYARIYSSYQIPPADLLPRYAAEFGPVVLFFVALGLGHDLWRRHWKTIFFAAAAIVTALLFSRVQAPGVQHFLPIALLLFPACSRGILVAWSALPGALRLLVPAALVLNFANAFAPPSSPAVQALRAALGVTSHAPLRLDGMSEYRRLTDDLVALGGSARIAVYASSYALSDDLLTAIEPRLHSRMLWVGQVDLRDGFRWGGIAANYVLIARPTPFHLNPKGQRVIAIPAEQIAGNTGIGASFVSTGRSYSLDGGIVAELYQRMRPIPERDLMALQRIFETFYPDWKRQGSDIESHGGG